MPGYLYSYSKFKKKFESPILKKKWKSNERIKITINPFILRGKIRCFNRASQKSITIMNNEMTNEQEKIYISYLQKQKY